MACRKKKTRSLAKLLVHPVGYSDAIANMGLCHIVCPLKTYRAVETSALANIIVCSRASNSSHGRKGDRRRGAQHTHTILISWASGTVLRRIFKPLDHNSWPRTVPLPQLLILPSFLPAPSSHKCSVFPSFIFI